MYQSLNSTNKKKITILPMQIMTKRTHYRRHSYWIDM